MEEPYATGMRIAIDDLGTGCSLLTTLRRFPLDTLEIDRSFIGNLLRDRTSDAIVRSVVAVARQLGLRIVAEGVGDESTFATFVELDCPEPQGFWIAAPAAAGHVTCRLDDPSAWQRAMPRSPHHRQQ